MQKGWIYHTMCAYLPMSQAFWTSLSSVHSISVQFRNEEHFMQLKLSKNIKKSKKSTTIFKSNFWEPVEDLGQFQDISTTFQNVQAFINFICILLLHVSDNGDCNESTNS